LAIGRMLPGAGFIQPKPVAAGLPLVVS